MMALVLGGIWGASPAEGSLMTYLTAPGTTAGGEPVFAKVTFTTTTDKITVLLENLCVNPKSVIQNISGLLFTVSTGQTTGTLISSSGMLRDILKAFLCNTVETQCGVSRDRLSNVARAELRVNSVQLRKRGALRS